MEKGSPYPQQQPPPPGYSQPPPAGYGQPPPAYPAAAGQQATVVLTQPNNVLARQLFREIPVRVNCPNCNADIMTGTSYETGTLTWLACGGMCLVGLWLGCCLIPFCIDACKDVVHTCPNCQQLVGKYNRLS